MCMDLDGIFLVTGGARSHVSIIASPLPDLSVRTEGSISGACWILVFSTFIRLDQVCSPTSSVAPAREVATRRRTQRKWHSDVDMWVQH